MPKSVSMLENGPTSGDENVKENVDVERDFRWNMRSGGIVANGEQSKVLQLRFTIAQFVMPKSLRLR